MTVNKVTRPFYIDIFAICYLFMCLNSAISILYNNAFYDSGKLYHQNAFIFGPMLYIDFLKEKNCLLSNKNKKIYIIYYCLYPFWFKFVREKRKKYKGRKVWESFFLLTKCPLLYIKQGE